jgi:hypothetical protein
MLSQTRKSSLQQLRNCRAEPVSPICALRPRHGLCFAIENMHSILERAYDD